LPSGRYENLFLTPREGYRIRVSQNMVLRKILGPKRDEVIGE